MRRIAIAVSLSAFVALVPGSPASAKSTGGCPNGASEKWELVTVDSLNLDGASGIASLDGNGDGNTCIKVVGSATFRDNTVGSDR